VAHCTFAGATADGVTEGGAPVRAVAGVRAVTSGAATVTVTVGGGRYSFAAPAG
jgi:hypothetical protein